MSVNEYIAAFRRLEVSGVPFKTGVPASEAEIAAIEKRLGVLLPHSYRAMLRDVGRLEFEDVNFAGWTKGGMQRGDASSVIFATENARQALDLKKSVIVVGQIGSDTMLVLDWARQGKWGEPAVLQTSLFDLNRRYDFVDEDFGTYLLERMYKLGSQQLPASSDQQ